MSEYTGCHLPRWFNERTDKCEHTDHDVVIPASTEYDAGMNKVIRVHTVEGQVYARIMEPITFPFPSYVVIEGIDVPAGLTQQGVVNHFRAHGWKVEQDHGPDFDHPEWGE